MEGYLSKAVHSTVIADPNSSLACTEASVLTRLTGRIVNYHRWGTALDHVYGDVVCPGECQDLRLSTPNPSITYGSTVKSELLRGNETSICGADPVFAINRWQEREEIVRVGINVISRGRACHGIIRLFSG